LAEYTKVDAVEGQGWVFKKASSLREAFALRYGEVISLVGAGGKSALMSALAGELAAAGESVITTTTTRIFDWQAPGTSLILEADEQKMLELLSQELKRHCHITLAKERLTAEGKLKGIDPGLVASLSRIRRIAGIIIEADGAARRSLKAPNATEPVIPQSTSLVIPIVGIDALGLTLTGENVFRPEIASRLTGLPVSGTISADTIATLVTHPQGIAKGSPPHARIAPLINKMDLEKDLARARALAARILEKGHPRVERVVLGQVQLPEPVVGVVLAAQK
jgi:probable selenium-dependent hydroxylase accessory protein YqeC